jgi:phosphatidylethanolamine/phosphatidyl-N-methylethanolamine N-methyltransferase
VLELGVGTGLALAAYPQHVRVTGIDLSPEMLAQAQQKIEQAGWTHITLRQMDATNLEFDDDVFDYVTAFHLVSVVPDHRRLIAEMLRVCKPGGTLLVVNHLRSERRWLAFLIDRLNPLTRHLGWRTDLRFADLADHPQLIVQRRFKVNPRSLFTVVMATKAERSRWIHKGQTPHPRGRSSTSSVREQSGTPR